MSTRDEMKEAIVTTIRGADGFEDASEKIMKLFEKWLEDSIREAAKGFDIGKYFIGEKKKKKK